MLKNLFKSESLLIFILYCISSIISGFLGLTYAFFKIAIVLIIFLIICFKDKIKKEIN